MKTVKNKFFVVYSTISVYTAVYFVQIFYIQNLNIVYTVWNILEKYLISIILRNPIYIAGQMFLIVLKEFVEKVEIGFKCTFNAHLFVGNTHNACIIECIYYLKWINISVCCYAVFHLFLFKTQWISRFTSYDLLLFNNIPDKSVNNGLK